MANPYVNDKFLRMFGVIDNFEMNKDFKIAMIKDLFKYREYVIREYNNDDVRAVDAYTARKFLQHFNVAVKLFGLHSDCYNEKEFNKLLSCLYIYYHKRTWYYWHLIH